MLYYKVINYLSQEVNMRKIFLGFIASVLFISLSADVKIKETYSSSFGFVGGNKGERTTFIKGHKQKIEETYEITGAFSMMVSKGKTMHMATITDIDRDITYHIDLDKGTYSEFKNSDVNDKIDDKEEKDSDKTKFEFDIKDMKKTKVINGFTTKYYVATMKIISDDDIDTLQIKEDMWMAQNVPGYSTIKEFNKAIYGKNSKALKGMDKGNKDMGYLKEFYTKVSEIKGYPIKTVIKMISNTEEEKELDEEESPSIGNMMKMLGKKSESSKENKDKETVIFKATSEVKSIVEVGIDDKTFKLNKEWKKVN
jgi:hypothetical protein